MTATMERRATQERDFEFLADTPIDMIGSSCVVHDGICLGCGESTQSHTQYQRCLHCRQPTMDWL